MPRRQWPGLEKEKKKRVVRAGAGDAAAVSHPGAARGQVILPHHNADWPGLSCDVISGQVGLVVIGDEEGWLP